MTLSTTPDNIPYPTGPASVGRIQTWFKNQADAVQLALNSLTNQHMEFTASKSIPTAAVTAGGVLAVDAAMSTGVQFAVPGADGRITINTPGVYALTMAAEATTAIVYDQWQLVISRVSNADIMAIGNAFPFQQRNIYISNPNVRILTPGEQLKFEYYKSSAGNHTINTRLRLTRLGRV